MSASPGPAQADGLDGTNGTDVANGHIDIADARELDADFKNINWAEQDKQDEANMMKVMGSFGEPGSNSGFNISAFQDKEIEQTGKADDAIDFEDISDDDLASDDDDMPAAPESTDDTQMTEVKKEDTGESQDVVMEEDGDIDDLFGDGANLDLPPSSPQPGDTQPAPPSPTPVQEDVTVQPADVTDDDWKNMTFEEKFRLNFPQEEPYSVSAWVTDQTQHQDPSVPIPPKNVDELIEQSFPSFAPQKVLFFRELFPEWPADFVYKEPAKEPPPLVPTKLELEIDADTAKLFRIPDAALAATKRSQQQQQFGEQEDWGQLVGSALLDMDDAMSDSDDENELVGGYTLAEFATICEDWDNIHDPLPPNEIGLATPPAEDEVMDDWDREFLQPREAPPKKRKYEPGLPSITSYDSSGINNFLEATKKSGRRIQLDQNDPYLLIEDMQQEKPVKRARKEEKLKRMANGQLGRDPMQRFNISNDEAYNALKANHKSKVRATLSNLAVEHSLPALKLTFPFYRTKTEGEFWEHHRPKFNVEKHIRHAVHFRKPVKVKRRDLKGRSIADVYKSSKDLSLNDNSTAILFEYCEQAPTLLNKFGMGSRVINYYRRKDPQDEEKLPKAEVGEPHVLLPEDRSPFSIFGTVDPNETVPTLHNEMYRAPIFEHQPRQNDFLLGYSTNAAEGSRYYLRGIDRLYVVGQTFPSMEVPGPHARKVTSIAKNRLKIISHRQARHRPNHDVDIREITPHVFDKFDPQNRQKMKEFLVYNKDLKTWGLREGDTLMDEAAIRNLIKPEDVCLVEAMQVGQSMLQHAGYDPKTASFGDEDDEANAEEPLVAKLAPWEMTKNFIDACAGKAMVALHGEGDPTGHGLGFSFIKTSMKGGYINAVQGPLATSADAIERERKANGGHSYNVKKQQEMYNAAIQDIWNRQKSSLSDPTTHDDSDVLDTANEDDRFNPEKQVESTPAPPLDDGRSQLSRFSQASRLGRRKLKIMRRKKGPDGKEVSETIIVEDSNVIRSYLKQRRDAEAAVRDVYSFKPTGDADADREQQKLVDAELSRLLKNADRRQIREKQGKGKRKNAANTNGDAGSPDPSGAADKAAGGTTRKCANCGQVGHIKTNKSKCPLLNGTISTDNNAADLGGFGSFGGSGSANNDFA
ncbi:hypothetical protein BX600DRAFT_505767 [Xylariales sp. PMI_506]|nr:hypothetical protein BX600DRAFT_505767 [Xylariales sp. PMI_506]